MDVQGLRDFTRAQMDVDETDLPDSVLNVYLQEAFDRTMAFTNDWPRNEFTWGVSKVVDNDFATLPPDLNIPSIMSVVSITNGYRLVNINHENAEANFAPLISPQGVGTPVYYSIWNGQLFLWPKVAAGSTYDMQLRGYRQPVWDNGASTIPDLDARLHVTLCYFALSLAYAKEEDEVLEAAYLGRWNRDLGQQMKMILEPVHHRPLVMHGGNPVGGTPSFVVNLPGP